MIVAIQFYDGDAEPAMSLCRLLADVEPRPRTDVLLALVSQPGTQRTGLVSRTCAHCERVFPVVEVTSPLGGVGHPEGCTALWAGTARYFWERGCEGPVHPETGYRSDRQATDSLLTLDGGDVVPLHASWIDLTKVLHDMALERGRLITGTPYFLGECPLHVNPNAVFELAVFGKTKLITDVPKYDGTINTNFDVYHREEMLTHTLLSSFCRTDWRGAGREATHEILRDRARESIFLHGYKDKNIHHLARELMASNPMSIPLVQFYKVEKLRVQERLRRDFEEALRVETLLVETLRAEAKR